MLGIPFYSEEFRLTHQIGCWYKATEQFGVGAAYMFREGVKFRLSYIYENWEIMDEIYVLCSLG